MRAFRIAALTLALMLTVLCRVALAEGPTMNLGKWEVTTVSTNSMMPKEITKTATECVTENKNPLEAIIEGGKCKVTNRETKAYTVTWNMECGDDRSAKGKGSFAADGNSGNGVLEMTLTIKDRQLTAKNTWTGKRVGECD